ncbi:alpha-2-macroglobulin family protein [Ottowia sp.]|uniref:alpha-2-macroglobulin family protein n=1 Tax=Ottowia sp. TaxID=1898956 RepID=UPI0039E263A5
MTAALLARLSAFAACLAAAQAQALTITALSPQGEVAHVRQVVAKFSENAVAFGDPQAPAPLAVRCDDAAASRGQGRWTSAREWVYDFEADLPPGVRCRVDVVSGFKSASGAGLTGTSSYQFHTGGPFVQRIAPGTSQRIEEDQVFVLRLNGPATAQSAQASIWCAVDGLGERVPIQPVEGEARAGLLKALGLGQDAAREPQRILSFRCARRLTPASRVQVVYGKGVATPSGIASHIERRFAFQVREPFTASLSCERENAQAACMPIRPIELRFSAPVPRRLLEHARLRGGKSEYSPVIPEGDADALLDQVQFPAPMSERTGFTLSLPPDLKDASGRPLANAASFPLQVATGPMPPLAKFAAAPFGIVERFAEGPDGPALLPVTLRYVEPHLKAQALRISQLQPQSDTEIIAWFTRVQRYDAWLVPRAQAARELGLPLPPPVGDETRDMVESRTFSLLAGKPEVKTIDLPPPPGGAGERPFEVVGVPLAPGFHVLELASQQLGQSLLDPKYGAQRTMVVRTSALVTNLGVHFKLGRENALAWVTTLDKGKPVEGAAVRVSDCRGKELASATTDAQGIARFKGLPPRATNCGGDEYIGDFQSAYFVSARATSEGAQDMAFTWSSWQRGIEPWRFNVPTSSEPQPDLLAHTVFDRTLLRAGETVSMKHLLRTQTGAGFGLPKTSPGTLVVTHVGSGQEYTQALNWRSTATGGRSAESSFAIPPAAKLGVYQAALRGKDAEGGEQLVETGRFRVEEFRLPVLQGRVGPESKDPLVAAANVPVQVQVNYLAGGPAGALPVRVSALTRDKALRFADYDAFSFDPPRATGATTTSGDGEEEAAARQDQRVVADKLPLTLDRNGTGKVALADLKPAPRAQDLLIEASFADPNGEIQTLRGNATLWPAAVVAGIQAEGWVSAKQSLKLQALALDLAGKPQAGVPLDVKAVARITTTSRKRMVGGFYTYDNRTETKDLGTVCTGSSDARGLLVCDVKLSQAGEVELIASARDGQGRSARAASTVWVTGQGELWFGGENHDRMDVLPEKKLYQPGETARLQVRMPFRYATALVAVEREGIVHTEVVELRGDDPTVTLKVDEAWGPNVYVSVLALRGRLREVPWYSFFTWGYKAPRDWWRAFWHESKDFAPATPLVDLSKPAFRLGMAEIRVGTRAHELAVEVKADKESYPVRGEAQVSIQVKRPDGQPAANAEVALAAVDQALLELMPNGSWKLLEAMLQRRAWGVETATAQMEIVGRRHYGRKAVPAGGDGGGRSPTRELLDTLLLWQPRIQLDAQGQAKVEVPLNDALTSFRIVAVADAGTGLFGTGETSVRATQDLQVISGLPPLVREGDQFRALFTLRNTTGQPMKVEVAPRATLFDLKAQTVDIPAGEARELAWDVTAPPQLAATRAEAILWEIEARDTAGGARDALKVSQRIVPAVPLTVQQGTLVQLDGPYTLDVTAPANALPASGPKRGGLQLALQPKLAEGLPGVRDWFLRYPYACLEQKTSKAIGLRDEKLWQQTAAQLPAYLDRDGLAGYFPPRDGDTDQGSDTLTAWLLAATHEAAQLHPAFALPDDARARMIAGLAAFVEGRIERKHWSPRDDLGVRKLAAIEALARHGAARPVMVSTLSIAPRQWPTSAVIDWIGVLQRVPGIDGAPRLLAEAQQVLRARLSTQGTRLVFSTEQDDHWWWLMAGGDVNAARLLLTVMDDAAWQDDLGRLVAGFIARQQGGAWATTTANLWGGLALERFSRAHESAPVAGTTRASLGSGTAEVDWAKVTRPAGGPMAHHTMQLPWPEGAAPLAVTHTGSGKPWLTLQSLAAIDLKAPQASGYRIRRTVTPALQADKSLPAGQYSRGDVLRVTLEITAASDMTWVAVSDPVPGGATLLGSGLGRDSAIATAGEKTPRGAWPDFEERSFETYRAYYAFLPKGTAKLEYTLRLNNAGTFQLPPSRVEALYAPEMFGVAPNAAITVKTP